MLENLVPPVLVADGWHVRGLAVTSWGEAVACEGSARPRRGGRGAAVADGEAISQPGLYDKNNFTLIRLKLIMLP